MVASGQTTGTAGSPSPAAEPVQLDDSERMTDEEQVNKYFYKLYVAEITTDQMIEVMRSFEACPPGSRDRETYRTMLKILFNECRFFPKYPVQELAITAELFGKMIKHGLLLSNGNLLMLALRCIIEALKRGKTSKMFQFGTIALSQFETSIANFPWFSTALLEVADVRETFPQLYKTCEKLQHIMTDTMHGTTYIDQAQGIVIRPEDFSQSQENSHSIDGEASQTGNSVSLSNKDRMDVGEMESLMNDVADHFNVVSPPGIVVSQIYAAFNNMSIDTAPQKACEVREVITPDNCSWLLLYIVKTRASKEQNLHEVFVSFIDNIRLPKLFDLAIQITYSCISACLSRILEYKEVHGYRTLLKNLGSWIGRITLGRNVPIMSRHLDLKQVMYHAYENGAMIAALPFVCKAMEHIKHSKIFKPPNPWTTAILNFLVEIHLLHDLKTSLVFEVEVLFKHLDLNITEFANKTHLLDARNCPYDSPDFDSYDYSRSDQMEDSATVSSSSYQTSVHTGHTGANLMISPIRQPPHILDHKEAGNDHSKEKLNMLLTKVMRDGPGAMRPGGSPSTLIPVEGNRGMPAGLSDQTMYSQPPMPMHGLPMRQPSMSVGSESSITMPISNYAEQLLQKLHNSVIISPSIAIFEIHPQLRACVPVAIYRAVRRVLPVISDHAVSIARYTTRVLVATDFAGEYNEANLRGPVHTMMDNFASSLVIATCKEPLRIAFHESLRAALQTYRTQDCNDQVLLEQLIQIISQDNLLHSIGVVEKIVAERVVREVDLLVADIVKHSRNQPSPPITLPPMIQKWNQMNIHMDKRNIQPYQTLFQGNVNRQLTTSQQLPMIPLGISMPGNACNAVLSRFEEYFADVREPLRAIALFPPLLYTQCPTEPGYEHIVFSTHALLVLYSLPVDHDIFACIDKCLSVMENSKHLEVATVAISHRLLMFLCEGLGVQAGLNVEVLLCVLDGLNRLNPAVKQALTSIMFSLPLDRRNNVFNVVTVTGLVRYGLLDWSHLIHYLSLAMDKGRNIYAVEMAIVVTAIAVIDQRSVAPDRAHPIIREIAAVDCGQEACETYPGILLKDARAKLLTDLMEIHPETRTMVMSLTSFLKRNLSACVSPCRFKVVCPSGEGGTIPCTVKREFAVNNMAFGGVRRVAPPPPISDSHRAIVSIIFAKWIECSLPYEGEALLIAWRQFFQRFNFQSLFKMDGGTDNFFAICVTTAIDTVISDSPSTLTVERMTDIESSTENLDCLVALAKMADVMLRLVGGSDVPPSSALQKVLASIASLILYGEHLMAYYKLWVVLLNYFDKMETETGQTVCKITFLNSLQMINPTRAPEFCYFWLKLIGHRFILLSSLKIERCWPHLAKLFLHMTAFLQANPMDELATVGKLYYDIVSYVCTTCPKFVVEHYFCIGGSQEMERLVGSCQISGDAMPIGTAGVSIDHIPAMSASPKIPSMIITLLMRHGLKAYVDALLRMVVHQNRSHASPPVSIYGFNFERLVSVLEEICVRDPGQSLTLLTSLTYYIGIDFGESLTEPAIVDESRMYLYLDLMRSLSLLGKYLFMRAICRHLRFPNRHTQFFSCLVLWMYDALKSSRDEFTRQVMLRVLLEHFLSPFKCPWGIKLTVIELFRNPRFQLNGGSFQAISGRIQSLLDAVSQVFAEV